MLAIRFNHVQTDIMHVFTVTFIFLVDQDSGFNRSFKIKNDAVLFHLRLN